MVKRFRAIIVGKVQGVFFRATAREQAVALGLKGFVRNVPDGNVEIEAEGEESEVQKLLRWCHHGPPSARVDDVKFEWKAPLDEHAEFRIEL